MKYDIIFSFDPGLTGGISIFEGKKLPIVYGMPLKKIIKNRKNKNICNLEEIANILRSHSSPKKKVLGVIEKQSARHKEGVVSSFTNGLGFGGLQGICYGLNFNVFIVPPATWKKYYPNIVTENSIKLKEIQRGIWYKLKNTKEKHLKKQYKKEADKIKRQIKADAKLQARLIAQGLYSKLKEEFNRVKDDGKAESLLIGKYVKDNLKKIGVKNGLV